ncbi:MAG: cytochrome c3 family protein [Planctomycetota bacterium]
MEREENSIARRRTARAALLISALLGLVACALGVDRVPVQDWWARRGPVVPHDSFPGDCSLCHTGNDWNTIKDDFAFDHEAMTGVALTGAHAQAECLRCHNDRGPVQVFASQGCAGCHENVHRGQLGDNCSDCHTDSDWRPKEQIAQHARTGFPLVGAHAATACWMCHSAAQEGIFTGASTDCASCHMNAATSATSVDHVAQGWLQNCQERARPDHSAGPASSTRPSRWSARTRARTAPSATSAGSSPARHGTAPPATPPSSPRRRTRTTRRPGSRRTARPATRRRPGRTRRSSTPPGTCPGRTPSRTAAAATPAACSPGRRPTAPVCHATDYAAATNPNHQAGGFPTSCETCHSTSAWQGANFDHSSWRLTGAHAGATCAECHTGGMYQGTPTDCAACHIAAYNSTSDPNHQTSGFPTNCEQCHTTIMWDGALFSHTSWPLTGAHLGTSCAQCHTGGVYQGTPTDCASCHIAEYNGTSDPNHTAAGFPTTCQTCHTTTMWDGATFNHSSWPLTGSHAAADCAQCHTGGVFQGTPTDCASCHLSDYNTTSDPNHQAAGFPTSCQTCHNTNTWNGATFNHSFPITTGKHKNYDCSDCHLVSSDYAQFSCTHCHAHNQSEMQQKHDEENVQNYVWSSPACYACHPDGKDD